MTLLNWAAVLVVALVSAGPAEAQWRRIDTPNFVVIGDLSARNLRETAIKFEGFRETLGRVLGDRATATAVPTVVVVFQNERAMAPFRPTFQGKPVDVAGLFIPGRDVHHIALVNDGDAGRMRVVFHEYTHLATSNSGQLLPVWLREGLAEYYSTFELARDGREAVIGAPIGSHLERLNDTVLMPLPELLKIDHQSPLYNEGSRRSVFYAQSWALTHMLLQGEPRRVTNLVTYIERLISGASSTDAWAQAFAGVNVQQELQNYIRRQLFRAYKFTFSESLSKFDAMAAPIPPADVQAYLGELSLEQDDYDGAAARFAQSLTIDPANVRAAVGRARLWAARREEGAPADLAALPTPEDWFLSYLAGTVSAEMSVRRGGTQSPGDLEAVRRFFGAAGAGRLEFPNAVARQATLELRAPGGPSADVASALERARARAPGRHEYALLHAQVLARRREYAKARSVLGPLLTSFSPEPVRSAARDLMIYVVQMENPAARGAGPGERPPAGGAAAGSAASATADAGSGIRLLFRELKPGEERVEGMLERVECVSGKGVTFHVTTADGAFSATAPRFDDVDFITYRSDLTGSISCGPLKEPMRVYLTWRSGAEAGSRLAVALEFLPKALEPESVTVGAFTAQQTRAGCPTLECPHQPSAIP